MKSSIVWVVEGGDGAGGGEGDVEGAIFRGLLLEVEIEMKSEAVRRSSIPESKDAQVTISM